MDGIEQQEKSVDPFDGSTSEEGACKTTKNKKDTSKGFFPVLQEHVLLAELKVAGDRKDQIPGIFVRGSVASIYAWDGVLFIRAGPYEGAIFKFRLLIPEDYPSTEVPRVFFQSGSATFHPKVDPVTGAVEMSRYFPTWNPKRDRLWFILKLLRHMFLKAIDTKNPVNTEAADLYRLNPDKFKEKVRECVEESKVHKYSHTANAIRFQPWKDTFLKAKTLMLNWKKELNRPDASVKKTGGALFQQAAQKKTAPKRTAHKLVSELFEGQKSPTKKHNIRTTVRKDLGSIADTTEARMTEATCKGWVSSMDAETGDCSRCWLVLDSDDGSLRYYKTNQQKEELGHIPLCDIFKTFQPEVPEMKSTNTFVVVTSTKTLQFRAQSDNSLHVWVVAIGFATEIC